MRPYLIGDFGLILSGLFEECIATLTLGQLRSLFTSLSGAFLARNSPSE
jgi:hypothetical protein